MPPKKRAYSEVAEDLCPEGYGAGMILKLYLENFMCHQRFEVRFSQGINFIAGENGSGKSAILTALQTVFGVAASATSRGPNVSSLIRTGSGVALVRVFLCNVGPDAFRPAEYGPILILERKLAASGPSTYSLRSKDGAVVSNRKADVELVLAQYNINIDCPCVCMTQDMSREFLHNITGRKLFQFFRDGTQISKVLQRYDEVAVFRNAILQMIETKAQQCKEKSKRSDELKLLITMATEVRTLEDQIEALEPLLAWALVGQKERELRQAERQLAADAAQEQEAKGKLAVLRQTIEGQEKQRQELTQMLNDTHRLEESTEAKRAAEERLRQAQSIANRCKAQVQGHTKDIETVRRAVAKTRADLEELQRSGQEDTEAAAATCEARVRALEAELRAAQEQVAQETARGQQADARGLELQRQRQQHEREAADADRDIRDLTARLRELGDLRSGRLRSLGPHLERLVAALRGRAKEFSAMPIGPLGALIGLTAVRWAGAVEPCIRRFLSHFLVQSQDDQQQLKRVCEELGIHPSPPCVVFGRAAEKYATPKAPPPYVLVSDLVTLERAAAQQLHPGADLPTVEATVFNCLVDWGDIDQVLVLEDRQKAQEVMFSEPPPHSICRLTGERRPIATCYLTDGSRIFRRGRTEVCDFKETRPRFLGVSPGIEMEVVQGRRAAQEQVRAAADSQLRAVQGQLSAVEAERRQLHAAAMSCRQAAAQLERDLRDATRELQQAQQQQQRSQQDELVLDLQSRIRAQDSELAQLQARLQEATERQRVAEADVAPLLAEQQRLAGLQEECRREVEAWRGELDALLTALRRNTSRLELGKQQLSDFATKLDQTKAALEPLRKTIGDAIAKTTAEVGPRQETDRSVKALEAERQALLQKVASRRRTTTRSPAELEHEYKELLKELSTLEARLEKIKQANHNLSEGLHKRRSKLRQIEKECRLTWGLRFNSILSRKGHSGSLLFDDHKQEVEMTVHLNATDPADQSTAVTNAKTLSGGEKSFTNLALCTALWTSVESPVRCMDEFDVFMDEVYRRKSLELLCEMCEEEKHQYIFLTPLGLDQHLRREKYNPIILRKSGQRGLDSSFAGATSPP